MDETFRNWHSRFLQQMAWTEQARDYTYRRVGFATKEHLLEIGCGTGALLHEVWKRFILPRVNSGKRCKLDAIDKDSGMVQKARETMKKAGNEVKIHVGNALSLPHGNSSFDVVFCQYFMLWNQDHIKKKIVDEVYRVLAPGGWFACLGEPDYISAVDKPHGHTLMLIKRSLERAGADLEAGAKLEDLMAPFTRVRIGSASKPWTASEWAEHFDDEWAFLERIMAGGGVDPSKMQAMKRSEQQAIKDGTKESYFPLVYAMGRKSF
ncbi:methyltransferase domain-containing protein [Candidatus Bathyarchaeota archaeon]|nr:methyltransferase domain-containing protein [Candidatus Bathyarchaeota archaeon]